MRTKIANPQPFAAIEQQMGVARMRLCRYDTSIKEKACALHYGLPSSALPAHC